MPPQTRSASTQSRLIGATAGLLRERGYHGAGLAEILAASGVPKGSLYHHFPGGKSQLAAQALHQSGQRIVTALERFVDEAGSVAVAVGRFCDHYVDELRSSDYRRGCPLATVALESGDLADDVHGELAAAMTGMIDLVARRIAAESPGAPDPRGLATEVVAAVEGALVLAKATRTTAPLETVRDRLVARISAELHPEAS
jgi:TetR/AcrR family transcriptional repressor of lmrAB and yxaGH operons